MKKTFMMLVALLMLAWAAGADAAPRGKAFYHGAQTPQALAQLIEQNLAAHPDGKVMLSPAKCRADASCAAPIDYLDMIQQVDPDAGLTSLAQLPEYLRALHSEPAPTGAYWMACLRSDRSSSTGYTPLLHCVARHFKPSETVWVSKSGKKVFASDCSNPIEGPEVPPPPVAAKKAKKPDACVYIRFSGNVSAYRFKQYGPTDESADRCTALLRAGETEWESPFVEQCPNGDCNFADVDAALGESGWETGSFAPEKQGVNVLRLPAKFAGRGSLYRMVFCADRGTSEEQARTNAVLGSKPKDVVDGHRYGLAMHDWNEQHSCGVGVRWYDFVLKGDKKVATIYPDEANAGTAHAMTVLRQPTDLWWHWGDCYR